MLRKVNVDMSCIAFNNQQLKQKNEDMKEVLGEMSIRRQFIHGADENSTQKDMMIEKLRQKVKSLKRRVRQEDDEGAMSDTDDDDDDEDEDADDEEDDDDTEAQAPASVAPQALIAPLAINVPQPLIAPETFNAPQTSIAPEALSAPFPLGPPFPLGHDMNPFIPRAELTDDDIANNGRDVEFEPEAEEKPLPFDIPGQQYALPCLPSTSQMENGVYHLFEYHKSFLK